MHLPWRSSLLSINPGISTKNTPSNQTIFGNDEHDLTWKQNTFQTARQNSFQQQIRSWSPPLLGQNSLAEVLVASWPSCLIAPLSVNSKELKITFSRPKKWHAKRRSSVNSREDWSLVSCPHEYNSRRRWYFESRACDAQCFAFRRRFRDLLVWNFVQC